jgi:hypothetical protein
MTSNSEQYIAVGMITFLVLEQIVCFLYAPYLGRFGITIHSSIKKISIETIISRFLDKNIPRRLSMYKKEGILFFKNRYSYRTLLLGLCVCAARIMEHDTNTVIVDVKMCPLLFSFFVFGVCRAIVTVIIDFDTISASFWIFLNLFVWFFLIYIYYKILITRIAELFLRNDRESL